MRNSADKQELLLSQITDNYLQQHNFCGCDLNRIDLSGINLRGANLTGANLIYADLK
ncbi:pentapeptide repeat-containing protein [Cylindrospermum sp. NIES-4074]|nr:pentapeptide repeat-containing protein [Cylindrospermum sp. NIES-4074]